MDRRHFLQTPLALIPSWKEAMPRSFESEILERMAVAPVPGAVIGTVQNGSPGWVQPLGVTNSETKQPVAKDTLFQAASLTKQVTAYAAFALKLDIDRTLVSYVDDLKDTAARTVTVRQVLSHSSGFPNWRFQAGKDLAP